MERTNALGWWCAVPAALALLLYGATLSHPFLSDDYLVVHYLDRDLGAVRWERVLAEFVQPWFGVRDLYRPLVSLSLGVNLALGGADPSGFHLFNVLCLAGTGAAAAALARLVLHGVRPAGAAAVGCLLVVHPALVEQATWVAARTTGLEMLFSALACAAWASHLVRGTNRAWALLWFACALCSKEGAMALPLGLIAIDAMVAPDARIGTRLRRSLPFLVFLAAFLCWRKHLLGVFTTAESGHGLMSMLSGVLGHAAWLAWPPGPVAPVMAAAVLLLAIAAAIACRWLAFAALAWCAGALLPTAHIASPTPWEGRIVAQAVLPLCLLLALPLARVRQRKRLATAVVLWSTVLVTALSATLHVQGWYRTAAVGVERATAALHQALDNLDPAAPVGIASLAPGPLTIQVLQPRATFLLAQRPFAPADRAICGLTDALVPGDDGAVAALRALLDAGGTVLSWDDAAGVLRQRRVAVGPQVVDMGRDGPFRFAAAPSVGALKVAWVEVVLPEPAGSVAVEVLDDLPGIAAIGPLQAVAEPNATRFAIDLTRSLGAVVRGELGMPFPTLRVSVGGRELPEAAVVRMHRLPQLLPLPNPLEGREVDRGELDAALVPPTSAHDLELLLLMPHAVVRVPVPAGQRLALTGHALGQLRYVLDLATPQVIHYAFQSARGARAVARTQLDRFTVR